MINKILIIGANGYIGSFLKHQLSNRGYTVDGIGDRYNDYNLLSSDHLSAYKTIILLAGNSSVSSCQGDLKGPWNNNVRNFKNLADKLNSDQQLIYASSSSVYGKKNSKVYIEEDMSLEYLNNYDLTKTALDTVAYNYKEQNKNIIGLRFGTVNGSSSIIRTDLMINSMVHDALKNKKIIITNKNISRPILAIKDLASAVIEIINGSLSFGIYNLASFNSTVEEIANVVNAMTGVVIEDLGQQGEPYDFRISSKKFMDTYNFQFKNSIGNIVGDLIESYTKQFPVLVKRNSYYDYKG